MRNRNISAAILVLKLGLCIALVTGCLRRFSDESGDPYGNATFGGTIYVPVAAAPANNTIAIDGRREGADGEQADMASGNKGVDYGDQDDVVRAPIAAAGIENVLIYALPDRREDFESRVYPLINPAKQTFMFRNQASGYYTLYLETGPGTADIYKARIFVTSTYNLLLGDIKLRDDLLSANLYRVNATAPSENPVKVACQFNPAGYLKAAANDVGDDFTDVSGSNVVAGDSTELVELMENLEDSDSHDILTIATILNRGTRSFTGTTSLEALSGNNVEAVTAPEFTVRYGSDDDFTSSDTGQGDKILFEFTTRPAVSEVKMTVWADVFSSDGALLSRAVASRDMASDSGIYTYNTGAAWRADSDDPVWGDFARAGSIRFGVTITDNDSTSGRFGGISTEYVSIPVHSTAYDVLSLDEAPEIDGVSDDDEWPESTMIIEDDIGDSTGEGADIHKVYVVRDSLNLFWRLDLNDEAFSQDDVTYALRLGLNRRESKAMPALAAGERDIRIRYDQGWKVQVVKGIEQTEVADITAQVSVGSGTDGILECKVRLTDLGIRPAGVDLVHAGAYVFPGSAYAGGGMSRDSTVSRLIRF